MRVTFVCADYEALGAEYVSASLRAAGHETSLVFDPRLFNDNTLTVPSLARLFSRREDIVEEVVASRPDLVAFSVVTDAYRWFLDLSGEIRRRVRVPVLVGGVHPTLAPEAVIRAPQVDYLCVGEGEAAAVELADALARGGDPSGIPNLWSKGPGGVRRNPPRPPVQDLDSIPFPDKDLYRGTSVAPDDLYLTLASRGCAYRCTFCWENAVQKTYDGTEGKWLRSRSVENVLDELKAARARHPYRVVWFCDEIFTWNLRWLREFSPRYREEIGIPFLAIAHPNFVNEEVAELLASAGCVKVDMGIQSMTAAVRRDLLDRHETDAQIERAIRALRGAGLWVDVDNILNLPGEKTEDLLRMAEFYNEVRPNFTRFFFLAYYPGTDIVRSAVERRILNERDVDALAEGDQVRGFYEGDLRTPKEKRQLYVFLSTFLLFPPWFNRFLLRHALWRRIPTPDFVIRFYYVALTLFRHGLERFRNALRLRPRNWRAIRVMPIRYRLRYRREIAGWVRRRLGGVRPTPGGAVGALAPRATD